MSFLSELLRDHESKQRLPARCARATSGRPESGVVHEVRHGGDRLHVTQRFSGAQRLPSQPSNSAGRDRGLGPDARADSDRDRLAGAAATAGTQAQLRALARKLVDAGAPGVVVRVDDGRGRPVEIAEQASGTRRDARLAAGDEFRMGSNTKTVMATLVLRLVADGRLALNDPVGKWLPGQVPQGDAITLLNHTNGLKRTIQIKDRATGHGRSLDARPWT
ncbi:serine hydrolase [Solihabitans fulvus]|uniref:Serine hydrolase n=1 Tax=Solihabitans fulvus TaxID=1892852 RepID=A0A5B2XQH8_9PSEU|nr:serine hydrolase domain-containing protein [Solihabitans fulvus]KAA2265122.1 serine hydrolase [Solihabitans fulvus]